MGGRIRRFIKDSLKMLGYELTKREYLIELKERTSLLAGENKSMQIYCALNNTYLLKPSIEVLKNVKSQLGQDLFAAHIHKFERGLYFVEIGAANGLRLSNTYLLEKQFQWTGICVEPGVAWKSGLTKNRSAKLDFRAVYSKSGLWLDFIEPSVRELGTIAEFAKSDMHGDSRNISPSYKVETVSLEDLLDYWKAPQRISYLSIDTEGSEYSILKNFPFNRYQFDVLTVEHNYREDRESIQDLLKANHYIRLLTDISSHDDWYVHRAMIER